MFQRMAENFGTAATTRSTLGDIGEIGRFYSMRIRRQVFRDGSGAFLLRRFTLRRWHDRRYRSRAISYRRLAYIRQEDRPYYPKT